jgi:hypothetical protein
MVMPLLKAFDEAHCVRNSASASHHFVQSIVLPFIFLHSSPILILKKEIN